MCHAMGAHVSIAAVVGRDQPGDKICALLRGVIGLDSAWVRLDSSRPTTTKTRLVGIASGRHRQQVARIDNESVAPFVGNGTAGISGQYDAVIVSDYAKGFCTPETLSGLQRFGPVIVDPPKTDGWRKKYVGVGGCFVPNRSEAGGPQSIEQARAVASEIRETLTAEAVVIKLDIDGCVLATRDCATPMPTVARHVVDVCGAGDQFVATLGVARARGMSWSDACRLANKAAGLQCGRFGCEPIPGDEIWESFSPTDASTGYTRDTSPCSEKPALRAIR
jgi:D-beta-D-heptose 7-phosphate kinase/D-beta-D-heptose 1-phosphate adenosyltransferase